MRIEYLERVPRFYGICFYDPAMLSMVCYPVPFNIIVRWARNLWVYLSGPGCDLVARYAQEFVKQDTEVKDKLLDFYRDRYEDTLRRLDLFVRVFASLRSRDRIGELLDAFNDKGRYWDEPLTQGESEDRERLIYLIQSYVDGGISPTVFRGLYQKGVSVEGEKSNEDAV